MGGLICTGRAYHLQLRLVASQDVLYFCLEVWEFLVRDIQSDDVLPGT